MIQNQSTFEPLLRSPQISATIYEAEHMVAQSKTKDGDEGSEAKAADEKKNQEKEQAKVRLLKGTQVSEVHSAIYTENISVHIDQQILL